MWTLAHAFYKGENLMKKIIGVLSVVGLFTGLQIAGCAQILPTIPITLDLGDAGIAEFDVLAGVPEQAKANFEGDAPGIQAGRGTIEIDPASIQLVPAEGGGGKIRPANQQAIEDCMDACLVAGVDEATCTDVCDENMLRVTVSVGTAAEIEADCANGDVYEFDVELNDEGVPTSVTATPGTLTQDTIDLVNSGTFSICVEVISPIDGTVLIDEVVLNLGL